MDFNFGAEATLTAEQCAASYMYDFDVNKVSISELYRWGRHLNDYFDKTNLKVFIQCAHCDIENIALDSKRWFVTDGQNIILKHDVNPETMFERVLSMVNGKVLPYLYCARSLYQPLSEQEA